MSVSPLPWLGKYNLVVINSPASHPVEILLGICALEADQHTQSSPDAAHDLALHCGTLETGARCSK